MSKDRVRQILVVLAVLAMITVNILANALPINGQNTGEISDRFDVFFVPAGYVFSIWGLIYLGLLAYAVYQALPAQAENPTLRSIGYLFVLSCLANIAWIFLWHCNSAGETHAWFDSRVAHHFPHLHVRTASAMRSGGSHGMRGELRHQGARQRSPLFRGIMP